ncbi:hypothetical protein PhCBS80983_g00008 [Powellomyces hirtus]|uniref:Uncharacterized protein n=1 Tax=Powellomyces hirtus TaxID=109895 RepID=A0A507EHB8_9FUNG|nr:hypothetical protein PhCBS80983_g00008 [Powellomyces hirtus]
MSVTDSLSLQQPSAARRKAILDVLFTYFSNTGITGTVANIPKAQFTEEDWVTGWTPLAALSTFKRLAALTKNPLEIASVAVQLAPAVFEVSADGLKIRRRMPFDAKQVAHLSALESLARNLVKATGFAPSTTTVEVASFFAQYGNLANVTTVPGEGHAFHVDFTDPHDMIKVLAQTHTYEDSPIHVQGCSKPQFVATPADATHAKQASSTLEAHAGVQLYPRNRIVRFTLQDPAVANVEIKAKLAHFATIHSVDLPKGAVHGHVRLKTGVAKQLLDVVARNGGIQVNGDPVELTLLSGEEERLYWEVIREKEKAAPLPTQTPIQPPAQDANARRANARHQRRKDRAPYARSKKATANNNNNKTQSHVASTSNSKVKVDDLENLFSNWTVAPDTTTPATPTPDPME